MGSAHADRNAAREHYRKGTIFFNLQKYVEAAKEYEAAYEMHEDPLLLFNIAQSYRLGGEASRALGAYRAYLRNTPNAANRADVLSRIEELQRIAEVQKRSREAPPMGTLGTAPDADSPREGSVQTPETTPPAVTQTPPQPAPVDNAAAQRQAKTFVNAGIGLLAGGVAFIVIGGALAGVGAADRDSVTNATPGTVFDPSAESNAKTLGPAGIAIAIVGGVAAVSGVALLVVGKKRQRALQASLLPVVTPTAVAFSLSGRF